MTTAQEAEKLVHDLKVLVRDAEHLLKSGGHELSEKARNGLNEALRAARTTCQETERTLREAGAQADELVRKHPYEAAALAVVAGLLVGLLLGRK